MNNEDLRKNEEQGRRRIKPAMLILWICLLLALAGGLLWLLLRRRGNYSEMTLEKSYNISAGGQAQVQTFEKGLLRYSGDGVSFLSTDGREQWNISSSMNAPQLVTQGEYGALADLSGQTVVVFNKQGESGRYTTTDPIIGAAVSAGGVSAVALERDLNSLICFYDKLGLKIDIEISLEMSVSGYPMAMALSPDGSGLVLSMISSQGGNMNSQLVFYNFSVGRSETNRMVGFFNHEGRLLTQIDYLGGKRVAAVTDAGIEIYSLEQENKPVFQSQIAFPGEITAYTAGQHHAAFLYPDPASGDMMLSVYDENGRHCFTQPAGGAVRKLALGSDLVLLQTENRLNLWNYSGGVFFSGEVSRRGAPCFLFGRQLIQLEGSQIHHIKFR